MGICGYEAYMYIVQSEVLCGRGKGYSLCVLVVMRSISLGEDHILKILSGAGLTHKLLCTLALSRYCFVEFWNISLGAEQVD